MFIMYAGISSSWSFLSPGWLPTATTDNDFVSRYLLSSAELYQVLGLQASRPFWATDLAWWQTHDSPQEAEIWLNHHTPHTSQPAKAWVYCGGSRDYITWWHITYVQWLNHPVTYAPWSDWHMIVGRAHCGWGFCSTQYLFMKINM